MLDRNKSEVDLWSNWSSTYGTLNSSFRKNIERLEQKETVQETASVVYKYLLNDDLSSQQSWGKQFLSR